MVKRQRKPKLGLLLAKGFVITDHTGTSMRFFRSTRKLAIDAVTEYHRMPWDELKEICRCVPVEVREVM